MLAILTRLFLPLLFLISPLLFPGAVWADAPIGFEPNNTTPAPPTAEYFVLTLSSGLTNERQLVFSTPQFSVVDAGVGSTYTVGLGPILSYWYGTGATTNQLAFNAISNLPSSATGDIFYKDSASTVTRLPIGSANDLLTVSGGVPVWAPASGGAPADAHYIVSQLDGSLTNEHVITGGDGIDATIGVGTCDILVDSTVIRTTGTQTMSGPKTLSGGPIISGANSTGLVLTGSSFSDTITIADPSANRAYTIPDMGGSSTFCLGTPTTANQLYATNGTVGGYRFGDSGVATGVTTTTLTSASPSMEIVATGAQIITLPDAATCSGKVFWFIKLTTGDATINRAGADTIQDITGTATTATVRAGGSCGLVSDGTTIWKTIKRSPLPVEDGGTNSLFAGALSSGGIIRASGTNSMACSAAGTSGQSLVSGGSGNPTWFAGTQGGLLWASGASGILASTAAGSAGQTVRSTGTTAPTFVNPPAIKRKAADTSRNTTTTVTDDPNLLFAVAANEVRDFVACIHFSSTSTTPDLKFTFTGPSGSTVTYAGSWYTNANMAAIAATAGGTTVALDVGGNQPSMIWVSGTCTNGATPGNLSFQWAQNVSHATDMTVKAGSHLANTLR